MGQMLSLMDQGFFMSEQKVVQPTSGTATAQNAVLSWRLAGKTLRYTVKVEAPNACYSAGQLTHETKATAEAGKDLVTLNATVNYTNGMCAQAIKQIIFEGEHVLRFDSFAIKAVVSDERTGLTTVIE
jgi:hypothetical protein